mmetsp:Transcript_16803/g.63688  ORF Transcript_16803/g.63688 Transcript_16803/m.63688 type:complete len:211 (-) Transcript_16803:3949-4581(-)
MKDMSGPKSCPRMSTSDPPLVGSSSSDAAPVPTAASNAASSGSESVGDSVVLPVPVALAGAPPPLLLLLLLPASGAADELPAAAEALPRIRMAARRRAALSPEPLASMSRVRSWRESISGTVADVEGSKLSCPATVAFQYAWSPALAGVTHSITTWAVTTVQLAAMNSKALCLEGVKRTLSTCEAPAGPKWRPVRRTVVPPTVGRPASVS